MDCPYSGIRCVYVDTLSLTMEKPCCDCEYYNSGISLKRDNLLLKLFKRVFKWGD